MIVRFWEARVAVQRLADATAWVTSVLEPELRRHGASEVEVLTSDEDTATNNPARVVVISRWAAPPSIVEPVCDVEIIERAHAWNFEPI